MCDTQVLVKDGAVWFAKNSDRHPSEPQLVVQVPPVSGDITHTLRATHIEIPQVPDRLGVVLSKPSWIWGAEMGANDRGVVIGNEAIFSRLVDKKRPGLLGMDLVRLGLERGANARAALDVMTQLLELHGQGGAADYRNPRFRYDNSFVVADAREAWVLETAGRHWAAKRVVDEAAISNCLTLRTDYDLESPGLREHAQKSGRWKKSWKPDFAKVFDTGLMPFLAGAHRRLALSRASLLVARTGTIDLPRLASHLRQHAHQDADPRRGSNGDVCMHAMGPIRRSQTTGSMLARLVPGDTRLFFTGTSAPCLSLFRPFSFQHKHDYSVLTEDGAALPETLWWRHEAVHRRALFQEGLRSALRRDRDQTERGIFELLGDEARPNGTAWHVADQLAVQWSERQLAAAAELPLRPTEGIGSLYWRSRNRQDGMQE